LLKKDKLISPPQFHWLSNEILSNCSICIPVQEGYLAIIKGIWNSQTIDFGPGASPLGIAAFENHLEIFQLLFTFYSEQNQCKVSFLLVQQFAFGICGGS
jgi:hypothetical protein